jgi:hypothetical protein
VSGFAPVLGAAQHFDIDGIHGCDFNAAMTIAAQY